MKKKKILISILIFFTLIFTYYKLTHKKGRSLTGTGVEYYPLLCPAKDDYSICIIEDNRVIPATDQNWLTCGSEVLVNFKVNFTDTNYILCLNRDKLIGGNSEAPGAYNYEDGSKIFSCDSPVPLVAELSEWGTIPEKEGNFKFAELYAYPKELNLKEEELAKNFNLGKKILNIEREIKCQQNIKK